MIRYDEHTLQKYLDALAAREPVPGGGSAAAVCGSLAAALIGMAARYSLGKNKPPETEKKLEAILKEADAARVRLLELAGEDAQAYADTITAKKENPAAYHEALKKAGAVPRDIIQTCLKVHEAVPFLMKEGNKYLVSDVHAADVLLKGAVAVADIMIEANQAVVI
jgi:formiminotetrahydrofolate cyclodeaminase